jgi:hypothetical protein
VNLSDSSSRVVRGGPAQDEANATRGRRALEGQAQEDSRFERIVADQALDIAMLREVIRGSF